MTTELDRRQQAEELAKQQKVIGDNADTIFRSPKSYTAGNPDGDVTVVEFFDYNCGYCHAHCPNWSSSSKATTRCVSCSRSCPFSARSPNGRRRPRLPPASRANISRCIRSMYAAPGKADKDKALRVAAEIGLDVPQLEKDMEDPAITQALEETKELAAEARRAGNAALPDRRPDDPRALPTTSTISWWQRSPRSGRRAARSPAECLF